MEGFVEEFAAEHLEGVQNRGGFVYACCPFHDEKTPSFWIAGDGHWACWGCGESGQDLLALMQSLGVGTRKAKAQLEEARKEAKKYAKVKRVKVAKKARQEFRGTSVLPARELLPIFDYTPMDLVDEGFDEEILEDHKVGYDRKHERTTFPIWDLDSNLIGISGRRAERVSGPKYKVYQGWHENRDGVRVPGELGEWYKDYSSTDIRNHLWRGERVYQKIYDGEDDELIIVEGYKAALWLVQHGYHNTVALMGSTMTAQQERLIRRMGTPTWVFLDANYAGRRGSRDICWRLGNATFPVYECDYEVLLFGGGDGDPEMDSSAIREMQPDNCGDDDLGLILSSAKRKTRRMKRHDNSGQRPTSGKTTSKRKLQGTRGKRKKRR